MLRIVCKIRNNDAQGGNNIPESIIRRGFTFGWENLQAYTEKEVVAFLNAREGGLPYGVTEKDFFGGCSVPRNKEIMQQYRLTNLGLAILKNLNGS